jgi:hypothetical protein
LITINHTINRFHPPSSFQRKAWPERYDMYCAKSKRDENKKRCANHLTAVTGAKRPRRKFSAIFQTPSNFESKRSNKPCESSKSCYLFVIFLLVLAKRSHPVCQSPQSPPPMPRLLQCTMMTIHRKESKFEVVFLVWFGCRVDCGGGVWLLWTLSSQSKYFTNGYERVTQRRRTISDHEWSQVWLCIEERKKDEQLYESSNFETNDRDFLGEVARV